MAELEPGTMVWCHGRNQGVVVEVQPAAIRVRLPGWQITTSYPPRLVETMSPEQVRARSWPGHPMLEAQEKVLEGGGG